MKLGLYQGSIPYHLPMQRCLTLTAELNFDGLEIALEDQEPLLPEAANSLSADIVAIGKSVGMTTERPKALHLGSSLEDCRQVATQANQAGIRIHSLATMMHFFYPLSSANAKVRERGIQIALKMLRVAAEVGAETILLVPGVVDETAGYREVFERSKAVIRDLLPEAERRGVVLAIENVWNRFLLSPLETADYIDSFASESIGVYFDVANILQYGYPDDWLRILGPRVKAIHFKDFRSDIGNITGFTHLLHGDVPWERVVDALHEIEYQGYVTVEVPPLKTGGVKGLCDAKSSLDFILSERFNQANNSH